MDSFDFLSPTIVLGIAGLIIYALRNFIKAWIDSRVHSASQREFEQFRAELEAEKAHIAAVRDSVLSGRISRQAIVDQRRFDAIDQLWLAVREVDRFLIFPKLLETLKLDYMYDQIEKEPKIHELFAVLSKTLPGNFAIPDTVFQDHYIPSRIRDLFNLYLQIIAASHALFVAGNGGLDPRRFFKFDAMNNEVKKHLPHFSDFVDRFGKYSWIYLAQTSRDALSLEMRSFINGTDADYSVLEKMAVERQVLPQGLNENVLSAFDIIPDELKQDVPPVNSGPLEQLDRDQNRSNTS